MDGSAAHKHHIVPLKVYLAIGLALYILTVVTVMVSFVRLGGWNVVVALAIAALKASLVALFFMHLLYDRKIMLVIFITAVIFLAIFVVFTMFDTVTRGQINEETSAPIQDKASMYDSLSAPVEGEIEDSKNINGASDQGH